MLVRLILFLVGARGTRWTTGWLAAVPRLINRLRRSPAEQLRILLVRLDNIGDLVLNTPLLRELRRVYPQARITLVVQPSIAGLMKNCPYVDEILTYTRIPENGGKAELIRRVLLLRFSIKQLWGRRFDLAISPRRDTDWLDAGMMCYFSGANRRIGFSETASPTKARENRGFDSIFTDVIPVRDVHEVLSNLSVIEYLGSRPASDSLELWPDAVDREWADQIVAERWPEKQIVAMCVGASSPIKQWPCERFIEVARALLMDSDTIIVIIGGPGDVSAEQMQLALGDRVANFAGQISLLRCYALMRKCRLYVGNDTGPMHIAAAAGVPVVEVCAFPRSLGEWNSNSPGRFSAWGVPNVVLQPQAQTPPCRTTCEASEAHCILAVEVSDVINAVKELAATAAIRFPDPADSSDQTERLD